MKTLNSDIQTHSVSVERKRSNLDARDIFGDVRLAERKPTEFLLVEKGELSKIKKLIAKVKVPSQFYQNAFWVSVSLFFAAVILLLTIPTTEEREWTWILGWTMFVLFPISSVISLLVWKKEKSDFFASIEQVKEEIEYIEGKYLSGDEDFK